jgi:hypothetical protein
MSDANSLPQTDLFDAMSPDQLRAELRRVKAWQARILMALDHLQSGLVMYGPDDVLVFCNRRL